MTRPSQVEDFIPHRTPIDVDRIAAALADLDPIQTPRGVSVALPYTERSADGPLGGTLDTIEIGPYGRTADWIIYTGRAYHGDQSTASLTGQVATCPGHMVILVVRALHAHLTAVGPRSRADTYEGDVLYALGLVRDAGEVRS